MADLDQLRHPENLRRAWGWIRSNSDSAYKSYFRQLYQQFAMAEEALLDELADRLRREVYEPEPATKLFHPKSSGILRPVSLLSVEDQIVYQAAVNLIAEKLQPRVVRRYDKQVFGNLYAGKSSTWFYRGWRDGYKAFNQAARQAFADGFACTASFDLTACYDSLDHGVLRHFLEMLGLNHIFCRMFTGWLEKWTATEKRIYHNHGIPQGPLSSGLLSEVVLTHFDELKLKGVEFRYFRYVDDIRLFAKKQPDLRRLLVCLDLLSKDIGLFPQAGKISIHRVHNIEEELKTISNPPEAALSAPFVNQGRLLRRLVQLTPRYRVSNVTRFKYLLAHASPSAKLTSRLWRIMENHPEIYRSVCNYLRRYAKLNRIPAKKMVEIVRTNTLYDAVRAEFIDAANGRLPAAEDKELAKLLRKVWSPKSMRPDLQVAVGHFLIRTGDLSASQVAYVCKVAPSWWSRACIINAVNPTLLGELALRQVIDSGVEDQSKDVALAAAWKGMQRAHIPTGSRSGWNKAAEILLKELGMIQRSTVNYCGIDHALRKLDASIPSVNWRRLLGSRYGQAELQAVETVSASRVNITGFVNFLDVFNELVLDAVFQKDGTIGCYILGQVGSVLNTPASRFARKFPKTFALAQQVHDRRYESMASHPLIKRSGKPTKRISYTFLAKARRLLRECIGELKTAGLC